jgi:hypothetical protein
MRASWSLRVANLDRYLFLNQSSLIVSKACVGAVRPFRRNKESWMTKYDHLIAMLILIAIGTTVTIKTMSLATRSAALHAAAISGRAVTVGH